MDKQALTKLIDRGHAEDLPSGDKAIRVSLQYDTPMARASRAERRQALESVFEPIAEWMSDQGGQVDLASLSVSGQTVEALLPVQRVEELASELEGRHIRVDPVVFREVV